MQIINSQRGSAVLMAVVGLLFLGGLGVTAVSIVSTGQSGKANALASEQAAALAQAGIEYAKKQINQGASPIVQNFPFGSGTFSVAAVPNSGTVTSTGFVGTAKKTYSLTAAFGKDCLDLDVTNAVVAGSQITGMKLQKTCLSTSTVTHWTFSWNPNQQEKTVKLQVQGNQIVTLFDDASGFASDTMIDAVDFTMINNSIYPVNKLVFNGPLPANKTYTATLLLSDGSSITKSFQDIQNAANNPPPDNADPNDATPGYEVEEDGDVVVAANKNIEVRALCAEITYGAGGPNIPVLAWLGVNNQYNALFNSAPVQGGEVYTAASGGSGTTYTVKANGKYKVGNRTYFNKTYTSNNTAQVKTLTNGQAAPPLAGFGGQKPITECIANYINPQNGFVTLETNQVLLLFELGVNMQSSPNSPAADFQDLVVVLTID